MFPVGWVRGVCRAAFPFTGVSLGFRFHTYLCFIYTRLLFCYLRILGYIMQPQPLCACVCAEARNEFAHTVQSYLLGTSTGMSHFAHPQAAHKSELQKMSNWVFLKHGGSLKC